MTRAPKQPFVTWRRHPRTGTCHATTATGWPYCDVKRDPLSEGEELDRPSGRVCRTCTRRLTEAREEAIAGFRSWCRRRAWSLCRSNQTVMEQVGERVESEAAALSVALFVWEVNGGGRDHLDIERASEAYWAAIENAAAEVVA